MPNMHRHVQSVADHANTAGHTQEIVNIHSADQKWPDPPGGSTRSCTDEADGLESCPGMLSARIHVLGDVSSLRTTAITSVTLDLPARGAELRTDSLESLETVQMD